VVVLARENVEVYLHALQTISEQFQLSECIVFSGNNV
jgi:hypothetical protein